MLHIIPLSSFCHLKIDVTLKITIGFMIDYHWIYDRLPLDFDPMVILRTTSILGGRKEDKGMMCSITLKL
jgi:hypothetical protein